MCSSPPIRSTSPPAAQPYVEFDGTVIRVLGADHLAVFKVLFDRPKDWVDIATMIDSGTLDVATVVDAATVLLGDDDRVDRLRAMSPLR